MTVLSVIGARPQFVKAAVTGHRLRGAGMQEILVHTGQHYDADMSDVFFDQLGIPAPDFNLGVGSGSHARQTGAIMTRLEALIQGLPMRPDWVLVYGDTNSTVAAALVAAKLHIRLAHVEAGLRSFNRLMPEEINRVVTDRLSQALFCPTATAVSHLEREGVTAGVVLTGDVMLEATRRFARAADEAVRLQRLTPHAPGTYSVATVHRAENVDHPERLAAILEGLGRIPQPVVLPAHPRLSARLDGRPLPSNVAVRGPVGYLEMLLLVREAHRVLTDSGGLQKESVWLETPCVTLRDETEWTETLVGGWNRLVGADPQAIEEAWSITPEGRAPEPGRVAGADATELIVRHLR